MISSLLLPLVKKSLNSRIKRIEEFKKNPILCQEKVFSQLLENGKKTVFGAQHQFPKIRDYQSFRKLTPIRNYEQLYPWIERTLKGEKNILWPGITLWFSKSSGTTNARSKYIPITPANLQDCNYAAGRDLLAAYFASYPKSRLPAGKILSITGSHEQSNWNPKARCGDISAVLTENMPWYYALGRAPSKKTALLPEWEKKIDLIVEQTQRDTITGIAGVPTWVMVIIEKLLEKTRKKYITEIWQELEVFFHGAVNFLPYLPQFQRWIPNPQMQYRDIYNASEGFFAFQEDAQDKNMLLLLSHGVFYEFLPLTELEKETPEALPLAQVQTNVPYALVITTNSGLWRYLIGDTIAFTSLSPYKIRITGRTKSFINVFGEEVVVENADQALAKACEQTGAIIKDYTVGPIFLEAGQKGRHHWLIEFIQPPKDWNQFTTLLDETLQNINSDYAAKRYKGIALAPPLIQPVPKGVFYRWLEQRGRITSQTKTPRLSNERKYIEEILALINGATTEKKQQS
jgi:hypothetical protein